MDFDPVVKTVALTAAGLFAGYTWALSDAAVPAAILADEATQAAQWRVIYLKGFYISRPLCIINGLMFGYLAYQAPTLPLTTLHLFAALLTASGVPYALTLLRRTNGALSIRTHTLSGPLLDYSNPSGPSRSGTPLPFARHPLALTYAFHETASRDREKDRDEWTTERLVRRWQWHNGIRTWILILGTVLGAVGVAIDR